MATWRVSHWRGSCGDVIAEPNNRNGVGLIMFISIGAIVFIAIVVLVVMALRRT
jgi:hypothetical protein